MKRWALVIAVLGAALLLLAALLPLRPASRDEVFEIPAGTYDRRRAGEPLPILPERIDLTLGARDQLLLRNLDRVPQLFGPVLIMPGQSFRLPFAQAGSYSFDCQAHASGQMKVEVAETPAPGLQRLRWRAQHWKQEEWPWNKA